MDVYNPFQIEYYTEKELRGFGFKSVGDRVKVSKNCTIVGMENITIGNDVRIDCFCSIIATGDAELVLGSYIHIGAFCHLLANGGIELKDYSGLSQGVKIYSKTDDYSGFSLTNPTIPSQFKKIKKGKVTLGEHVIVGSNSVILPNVNVGEGAAIGALSLVTTSLDSWSIYLGNPLKRMAPRSKKLLDLKAEFLRSQKQ